jgi:SAM-dependent methyltransferase
MNIKYLIENGFPIGESPGKIPFTHSTSVGLEDHMTVKRLHEYLTFFDEYKTPVLDIGGLNNMGKAVESDIQNRGHKDVKMENTLESDFNEMVRAPRQNYGTVFCFEVLEHVMNPLLFMRELHKLLDHSGVLYISTPKAALMSIYASSYHFTEYKEPKLETLFTWAGFVVEKKKVFSVYPWWHALLGFRPLWRLMFQRYIVYKLRKP